MKSITVDCCGKHSNLQSFIMNTTPSVPTYSFSKEYARDLNSLWQPIGKDKVEYFSLGDLWEAYREWSVYGAGVPIILDNSETVAQYYVPYLSAIQIYTTECPASSRTILDESECESCSDDSESDKLSKSWGTTSEDSLCDQDSSWPSRELLGQLYFQYKESGSPYGRIPIVDKVNELAQNYPGLMTFRSVDISPASWMSVAWYPIYHIPIRKNIKDLSTAFLTYHTISASFQDDYVPLKQLGENCNALTKNNRRKHRTGTNYTDLAPFGIATYKMQEKLWIRNSDGEILSDLYSAAYSWLNQLKVEHPDFNFFTTHY